MKSYNTAILLFYVIFGLELIGSIMVGSFYSWYINCHMFRLLSANSAVFAGEIAAVPLYILYSYRYSILHCICHPEDFDQMYE